MALQTINEGISGAEAAELIYSNDLEASLILEYSAGDEYTSGDKRTYNGFLYRVKNGVSGTIGNPEEAPQFWVDLGNAKLNDGKLNDVTYRKNLFVKTNLIDGLSLSAESATLVRIYQETGSVLAFAELPEGQYTVQGFPINQSGFRMGFFDALTLSAAGVRNNTATFNFPADKTYFVFSVKNGDNPMLNLDAIQIEVGDTATAVANKTLLFLEDSLTGAVAPENKQGVNGGDIWAYIDPIKKKTDATIIMKNLFNKVNVIMNRSLSVNGDNASVIEEEGSAIAWVDLLDLNSTFTLSGTPQFNVSGRRGALFNTIDPFTPTTGNRVTQRTFSNTSFRYFVFSVKYQTGDMDNLDTIQVEKGTAATDYLPYGEYVVKGAEAKPTDNSTTLFGASFAYPDNPWYDMAKKSLGGSHINRADGSGINITHLAEQMYNGTAYTARELDSFRHLVLYFSHNNDVSDRTGILENYQDYEPVQANVIPRHLAWDYVLKKYYADCYALKDDPDSPFFGTVMGKPVSIAVFTDYQDVRTIFNESVRALRDIWGFYLIELDVNIGFSKNQKHPVTGQNMSVGLAVDTQVIGGETYGWHPVREESNYIQQRTAAIFVDAIKKIGGH